MTSGPGVRSGAVVGVPLPETSPLPGSPFGSTFAPSHGATTPTPGAAPVRLPSLTMGFRRPQVAAEAGVARPASVGGAPRMSPPCGGVGVVQAGFPAGNPPVLGTGMDRSSSCVGPWGGSMPPAEVPLKPQLLSGSGLSETVTQSNNPFLFLS